MDYVDQYIVGVLLEEDAVKNEINDGLPGLVGLRQRRQPSNEVYFRKLSRNDEFHSLYQLGASTNERGTDEPVNLSLPKQIIIGRMGLIYYIGPMLDNEGFKH